MPYRTAKHWLTDILESIRGIQTTLCDVSKADYMENPRHWSARMAVMHALLIISEASRQLPDELKKSTPHLDWGKIAGIGNKLRHEYHKIDDGSIYDIAAHRLNELEQQVLAWIKEIEDKEQS